MLLRLGVVVAAVAAAVLGPGPTAVAADRANAAGPAGTAGRVTAANQWACAFYLASQGYSGLLVDIGCASGAGGDAVICRGTLRIAGVPAAIAEEGCRKAAET